MSCLITTYYFVANISATKLLNNVKNIGLLSKINDLIKNAIIIASNKVFTIIYTTQINKNPKEPNALQTSTIVDFAQ